MRIFSRGRGDASADNGCDVRKAPFRLSEVRMRDIGPRMDELFPDFRFWFSGMHEGVVVMTVYRKGIAFPFGLTMVECCSLWQYESVVPLRRKLMDRWDEYRKVLMSSMMKAGEPKGIVNLMEGITMDNEEGYLVSGMKEIKEGTDADGGVREGSDEPHEE